MPITCAIRMGGKSQMNEEESLELRARILEEMIDQHGTLGSDDLKEFAEISERLRPYRCIGCFKVVYGKEDYVLRHGVRTHRSCNEKIESNAKKAKERLADQKQRWKQQKYDVEHNIKPTSRTIAITVQGLKKDIDNFDENLEQIVKDYNLEPWMRIS